MLINDAFAAAETAAAGTGALGGTLVQLALILLIFYFFLIRPQQKRMREHSAMVEALKTGDNVMLGSGIYGKITAIKDDKLQLEIADGVEITVDRMTVGAVVVDEKNAVKSIAKTKTIKTKKSNKK